LKRHNQTGRANFSKFDAVCSFQVLEHLSDPLSFLKDAINLIKPGGKLIISVPNQDSFIRFDSQDLLNMPPHHMARWSPFTFKWLERILPLELETINFEPLAVYHVDWYILVQCSRFSKYSIRGLLFRIARKYMSTSLKNLVFSRKFITGHTLYVVFKKK
jgi:SAM-dependent methyltransferase